VVSLTRVVNGSTIAIKAKDKFLLVTNDFIIAGGDGFGPFTASQKIYPAGPPMDLALGDYITAFSPVSRVAAVLKDSTFVQESST
jgi:hypothetical protein